MVSPWSDLYRLILNIIIVDHAPQPQHILKQHQRCSAKKVSTLQEPKKGFQCVSFDQTKDKIQPPLILAYAAEHKVNIQFCRQISLFVRSYIGLHSERQGINPGCHCQSVRIRNGSPRRD